MVREVSASAARDKHDWDSRPTDHDCGRIVVYWNDGLTNYFKVVVPASRARSVDALLGEGLYHLVLASLFHVPPDMRRRLLGLSNDRIERRAAQPKA